MAAQSKYWIEFLFMSNLKDTNSMGVLVGSLLWNRPWTGRFSQQHPHCSHCSEPGLWQSPSPTGVPCSSSCANALHSILFHLLPTFFMCLCPVYIQPNHSLTPLNLFFKPTPCQSLCSPSPKSYFTWLGLGFLFWPQALWKENRQWFYTKAEVNLFFFLYWYNMINHLD